MTASLSSVVHQWAHMDKCAAGASSDTHTCSSSRLSDRLSVEVPLRAVSAVNALLTMLASASALSADPPRSEMAPPPGPP